MTTLSDKCGLRLFQHGLHLWLLEVEVLSILDGEVNVLQDDVDSLLICAVKGQEPHHAVVLNLDRTTVTTKHVTQRPFTSSHQTTDGFCQLLKLSAPDAVRVILYHRVHVRVQIPAGTQDYENTETSPQQYNFSTENSLFNLLLGFGVQQVHFGHDIDLRDL